MDKDVFAGLARVMTGVVSGDPEASLRACRKKIADVGLHTAVTGWLAQAGFDPDAMQLDDRLAVIRELSYGGNPENKPVKGLTCMRY